MTDKPVEDRNLWELTRDEIELRVDIEASFVDGVCTDDKALTEFNLVQMASEAKRESYRNIIEDYEHRAAMAKAELDSRMVVIDRLKAEKKHCESKANDLKTRLKNHMIELLQSGEDSLELKAGARPIRLVGAVGKVVVSSDAKLTTWDDIYYEMVTTPKIDTKALYRDYKDKPEADRPHGVEIQKGWTVKL